MDLSAGGRSVDSRLQLNKRWCAVCMGFSANTLTRVLNYRRLHDSASSSTNGTTSIEILTYLYHIYCVMKCLLKQVG